MQDATPFPPDAPLSRWERRGLIALAVLALLFGCLVEFRSAFLKRRMTDLDVYLRAAWAVRSGNDLYQIEDDNHWHYHYPPLFAILMTPLADAPTGADRTGMLPFAASAAIWYVFNWVCLGLGIHLLASALEQRSSRPEARGVQAGSRRWWALRVIPFLACLSAIGGSLMRGQVDVLLLLLVCGMAAAALHKRSWQAGFWLAGAICSEDSSRHSSYSTHSGGGTGGLAGRVWRWPGRGRGPDSWGRLRTDAHGPVLQGVG